MARENADQMDASDATARERAIHHLQSALDTDDCGETQIRVRQALQLLTTEER